MEEEQIQQVEQQSTEQPEQPGEKKSRWWLWLIIALAIIIIAVILIWGFYTNWGFSIYLWKSFSAQEARGYCAQACKDLDKGKFCESEMKVYFDDGSGIGDATCKDLVMNKRAESCPEIICGDIPPPIS